MSVILHQILAVLPVLTVKFMTGLGIGWVAPMLPWLRSSPETNFTPEQCAWIAAGHYITRGFSPFLAILTIDRLGRSATLVFSSIVCFVMWLAIYYSRLVYVHYAVRLLLGVGVGLLEATAGIYIGENASPKLRGFFGSLTSASFYFGELVVFLLAAYLSYEWLAVWNGVLGILVIFSTLLLREPAQRLIMKGNMKKAEKNYDYLHDLRNPKSKAEFDDIQQYVNEVQKEKFSWQVFRLKEVRKSVRIVLIINLLCVGGGFTAVNSYVTMALAGSENASYLTVWFGLAQFLSVLISSVFIDLFNRRTLFLLSSATITLVHAATAALYYFKSLYTIPYFEWQVFSLLTLFSCLYGMSLGPLPTTVTGEILPQNVKAMGSSFSVVSGSVGGFLSAKVFLTIEAAYGMHYNFVLFSLLNLILFVYVYFDLPETKGKTLVDIQRELRGKDACKDGAT